MRIGSMFARGSGSALKWAALLGVMVALGAGSASAQITETTTATKWTKTEGESFEVSYELKVDVPNGAAASSVTVDIVYFSTTTGQGSTNPGSGEPTDTEGSLDLAGSTMVFTIPAHVGAGGSTDPEPHDFKHTANLFVLADPDAEDEIGNVAIRVSAIGAAIPHLRGTTTDLQTFQDIPNPPEGRTETVIGVLTIDDPHEQKFVWDESTLSPTAAAGGPVEGENQIAAVTIKPDPLPVDYIWNVQARTNSNRYIVGPGERDSVGIPAAGRPFGVQAPESDGNRVPDEVELSLYLSGTSTPLPGYEPYTFTFKDIHPLPAADKITWKAYGSKADGTIDRTADDVTSIMEGGDPVHVEVTVERGEDNYPTGEAVVVNVMAGEGLATDYRTEDTPLEFPSSGSASNNNRRVGMFRVYASEDNDIAMEDLVLNLVATGKATANGPAASEGGSVEAANPVMLTIMDATEPLLTPMAGEMVMDTVNAARTASAAGDGNDLWTPGERFSLDGDDLFTSTNTVQVAAMSSSGAVGVSTQSGMVMVEAMEVGTATITITGTVASSFTSTQTVDNIATIEFDLTVDELPLEIELSGPDDLNIAEGMSAMVTATANRAVNADTRVVLNLVGGSGSPADYSVEPIMIMSGQTTGTTMLMATEDGMDDAGTGMPETLTFEGTFGRGMTTTNRVTFNIWDAAVPALPIIAQLLLAAFLAVGGYRRYLRRR